MATDHFQPVRLTGGLPPRRDSSTSFVEARAADVPILKGGTDSIIVPVARDRMLELIEREQLPNDVRSTLAGALSGDLRRQQLLFQAMIDTWPRLQKALGEVKRAARKAPWKVRAWAPRGGKPDTAAEALAKEVENDIWAMKPDPVRGLKGFEKTVEELAMGYFIGHQVLETRWGCGAKGGWKPTSTKVVPPRFYGYPYDGSSVDDEDRLMLDLSGGMSGLNNFEDFPPHRFLVAINGGHPGHPTIAAPLRALTGYWLAAVYGLKWFLQFAQLCGVPIRWAEYGSEPDKNKVSNMLEKIGQAGWGAFPAGTKLNFVETTKSANDVPQKILIDLADEQCDIFILGQTLTSSQGDKGSQALGKVHEGVRQDVIEGVCDFVGEVLSYQLAPSIVELNYGASRTDIPGIWVEWPETKDEKALAERDVALGITTGKMPVSKPWFYERHGVPMPADGEDVFQPEPDAAAADPAAAAGPVKTKSKAGIQAADAGQGNPLTVDQLSGAVLEGLTGVSQQWLSPVRPFFDRLAALAMSKHVTDEDFLAALEKARIQLPEIFDLLDTRALETAFENAIGSAALAGSVSRYE